MTPTDRADAAGLRIRPAVRALVLDPHDRVLLVRFELPDTRPSAGTAHPAPIRVWALPGGGVEPDEDELAALRRELVEELGLHDVEIGPHVWNRLHIVPFASGHWDGQRERVHLVRVPAFDPRPTLSWEELEAEYVFEMRWWTLDEIAAADERFAPRALADLLARLLADGPPAHPIDTGV